MYTWQDLRTYANFAYNLHMYANFAYMQNLRTYANLAICTNLLTYAKAGNFAPATDQVQISFCVYAKFAYMQIWSCEQRAIFAHVSIYLIVLNNY